MLAIMKLIRSSSSLGAIALFVSSVSSAPVVERRSSWPSISLGDAETAYNVLQQWYDWDQGLWTPSTGWWNSANCITVIADLSAIDGNVKNSALSVFSNTFDQAPTYSRKTIKTVGNAHQAYLPVTTDVALSPREIQARGGGSGFINNYYDDEGWWALAWIAAYDVTGDQDYLDAAQYIFGDMQQVFGQTDCSTNSGGKGGIWWDKSHTYVNAIANELFLSVAAHLANRRGSSSTDYLSLAQQQWSWFQGSGMINSGNTINDGLTQGSCTNNGGTVWSYNQGVILGGLVELSKATGDGSYISKAQSIADAAIAALAPNGILRDPCEPNCGGDGTQFKGIFMRNLQQLQQADPQARYATFLSNNAGSIWSNDRNGANQLSVSWAGPFVNPANASTQSSALDALVASLAEG